MRSSPNNEAKSASGTATIGFGENFSMLAANARGIAMSPVEEVIDYIHGQSGIAVAAHPFRQRQSINVDDAKMFDALEVINGNTFHEGNRKAKELALKFNVDQSTISDIVRYQNWKIVN